MGTLSLLIKTDETQALLQQKFALDLNKTREVAGELATYFKASAGGIKPCSIQLQTGSANPVAASGTATLVSVGNGDALTVGTVTLTGAASPANENQFATGGANDTADAVVLAAAINAHSVLSLIVSATSASNVVTITSKVPGVIGNQIPLSETGTTITVSGSYLASGAGGATDTIRTYALGI